MGCGKNHVRPVSDDNCVCTVLRAIVEAQNQVSPVSTDCSVSCERSIQELLNGVSPASTANTIPVILYCGCEPFKGFGASLEDGKFDCVETFIFRVISVDGHCCARLELLEFLDTDAKFKNPCDQFGDEQFKPSDLQGTGICITVDLDCFCAVTCLDPVTI